MFSLYILRERELINYNSIILLHSIPLHYYTLHYFNYSSTTTSLLLFNDRSCVHYVIKFYTRKTSAIRINKPQRNKFSGEYFYKEWRVVHSEGGGGVRIWGKVEWGGGESPTIMGGATLARCGR